MAIAGWLLIGVALLVLISVINNSWQPLIDQFRAAVGGQPPGFDTTPGAIGALPLGPPSATAPETPPSATTPESSGGGDAIATPEPIPGQVVMPGAPPAAPTA
jgi:hypothetical protein